MISRKKLSTYEAAAYLGLGKSTLDKMRVTGIGPAFIKIGKRVVYLSITHIFWSAVATCCAA